MTGGVVDKLELVQVDVTKGVVKAIPLGARHGAREAALELAPVDQSGQRVMSGVVLQLLSHSPCFADIVKDQHRAQHRTLAAADWGDRVLDGVLLSRATDEEGVERPDW